MPDTRIEELAREIAEALAPNLAEQDARTVIVQVNTKTITRHLSADAKARAERDEKVRELIRDFGWIECPDCRGLGFYANGLGETCDSCGGKKTVLCEEADDALRLLAPKEGGE